MKPKEVLGSRIHYKGVRTADLTPCFQSILQEARPETDFDIISLNDWLSRNRFSICPTQPYANRISFSSGLFRLQEHLSHSEYTLFSKKFHFPIFTPLRAFLDYLTQFLKLMGIQPRRFTWIWSFDHAAETIGFGIARSTIQGSGVEPPGLEILASEQFHH